MEPNIVLKKVNKNDHHFLYDLLKERDPKANISHKKLPSFKQHVDFIRSRPYTVWYVIHLDNEKIGSIYLSKQDEIGIFLKKGKANRGMGSFALNLLMKNYPRKRYLANVSPKNKKSALFFKKHKFTLIQHTYELNGAKS